MLVVLAQWIVLALCLLGLGMLVLRVLPGQKEAAPHPVHVVFSGYAALIVVVALWNYVLPVSQGLSWFVAGAAIAVLAWRRAQVRAWSVAWWGGWTGSSPLAKGAWLVVVLIAWVKSASPSEVPDDGHYFIPYIQWIEQFRLTPGIANLDDRFGFNSAAHLAAAFSGSFHLLPHGYGLNGFLLLAFGSFAVGGVDRLVKGSFTVSDAVRAFGLIYLLRNLLTSVSGDVPNVLLGQLVFILALQKIERRTVTDPEADFHRIVLYSVVVATIKLSSLFIALVPLYLLLRILRAGRRPSLAMLIATPLVIGLPWVARFPVLSGYLVFPIHSIDVLDPDWKVPEILVRQQYYYVGEFAKSNAKPWESEAYSERTLAEWVPAWFARENSFSKGVVVLLALFLFAGLVLLIVRGKRLLREHGDLVALIGILALNTVLWFLRYPAFRFGWAWLVVLLALGVYFSFQRMSTKAVRLGVLGITLLFVGLQGVRTVMEARMLPVHALLSPAPLPTTPFREVDLGGFSVRVPEGQYCNTVPPPCLPPLWEGRVAARGGHVEDGFRWYSTRQ